jgi:transcriptional regulator with XRE-family HTH domain
MSVRQEAAKLKYLKYYREKIGFSQKKLAQMLGVDENTIWRWEKNKSNPPSGIVIKAAESLGISVDELLNGPQEQAFTVTLKYAKTLEGVNEEMNMNGISLTIADDGFVGVSGGKKLESIEDIDRVVDEVRRKLVFGFEHRDEMKGEA